MSLCVFSDSDAWLGGKEKENNKKKHFKEHQFPCRLTQYKIKVL